MKTFYDTLGVVPAADRLTINDAYIACVIDALPSSGFPHGSMKWHQCCIRVAELTEAMDTLSHGERRDAYNKTLVAAGQICGLCSGSGTVLTRGEISRGIKCIACDGTGKGVTSYSDLEPTQWSKV